MGLTVSRNLLSTRSLCLSLCIAAAASASGLDAYGVPASADSPTATIPAASPVVPTVPAATPLPPTVQVIPESPVAEATLRPTAVSRSTAAPSQPQPTAPISGPGAPSDVSLLPSPAQLQADARLRWGTRIPSAVRRWAFLIAPAARRYHVDPKLVAAVMTMESGGDPSAWNQGSDARGLMQVLHGSWSPAQNIDVGTRMLAGFLAEFHDLRLALAAYNAGPGAVLAYHGVPPYRETHDYVIIVTYLYDLYSHRHLSSSRSTLYTRTVHDLRRFASQRKKVGLLSRAAATVSAQGRVCAVSGECVSTSNSLFPTMDPFWPIPGSPDPLIHIGPQTAQ